MTKVVKNFWIITSAVLEKSINYLGVKELNRITLSACKRIL